MFNVREQFLRLPCKRFGAVLLGLPLCAAMTLPGQEPAGAGTKSLPDSPRPQTEQQEPATGAGKVVGYVTKRSLFFPDIASKPGPMTVEEKFKLFGNEAISPLTFFTSAVSAGLGQARDTDHDYGQGMEGYGKRFGASMARGASNSFFGTFVLASALHQDPRFFPQLHPTLWGSVKYSAQRIVITRNDSGNKVFNISQLVGTLGGETLANTYLPVKEQTGAKTMERYGSDLAWRFASNMFKNYWPTIFKGLGLQRLKVVPAPNQQRAY
jgi:hypothetical protein